MSRDLVFRDLVFRVQSLVERHQDEDERITIAQLLFGGEHFDALHTLILEAGIYGVELPDELRDEILAAIDGLSDHYAEDVAEIRRALGVVPEAAGPGPLI